MRSAPKSVCSPGRFRIVWAVENTFDPHWSTDETAAAAAPSTSDARVSSTSPAIPRSSAHTDTDTARQNTCGKPKGTITISLEYIILVSFALSVVGLGVVLMNRASVANLSALGYPADVLPPKEVFAWLFGAVGQDTGVDQQWGGFSFYMPFLAVLNYLLSYVSAFIRTSQQQQQQQQGREKSGRGSRGGCCFSSLRRLAGNPMAHGAFQAFVGLVFIAVAHGPHFVFPLLIVTVNFVVFTTMQRVGRMPYAVFMSAVWITHVGVMLANEAFAGYENVRWIQRLLPSEAAYAVLGDNQEPLWPRLMRWHITYRMYVLRMIAFNYDMWEANRNGPAARERAVAKHLHSCVECAQLRERLHIPAQQQQEQRQGSKQVSPMLSEYDVHSQKGLNACGVSDNNDNNNSNSTFSATPGEGGVTCADGGQHIQEGEVRVHVLPNGAAETGANVQERCYCYKLRTEYPRDPSEYTYISYLAYILYLPLYVAGPITSFNAFVSHMCVASEAMPRAEMRNYILRTLFSYVCIDVLVHTMYLTAFTQYANVLQTLPLGTQLFFLYFYLAYLYLKFNCIWKTGRLFSMWYGIEVPENMLRCFSNSCFTRDFWRCWHASFNLWIVRYMYIPLGGRKRMLFSVVPIFFFIAVWHDHELNLLKWAALIILIFVAEVMVGTWYGNVERAFGKEMAKFSDGNVNAKDARATRPTNPSPARDSPLVERNNDGTNDSSSSGGGGCGGDGDAEGASSGNNSRDSELRNNRSLCSVAARFAATRMTPHQREYVRRVLTACGGALAVAAQIVANIIGYSVQRDTISESLIDADKTWSTEGMLHRAIRVLGTNATVVLISGPFLYTIASSGTLSKKRASIREKEMKKRYGLY